MTYRYGASFPEHKPQTAVDLPVPLLPCKCGLPSIPVDVEHHGKKVGTGRMCWACAQKITDNLAKVRPVFDAMLAAGINRELANDTMTFILDRHVFPNERT